MAVPYIQRIRRQNAALLVAASAAGLWLGVTAPAISPVAPAVTATAPAGPAAPAVAARSIIPDQVRPFRPHHSPR